ncbi:MAG: carboxypeptidase-like regulatory domain-containing protein [Terracidiphilus sp.]
MPDAPQPIQPGSQASQSQSENTGTGNISGTVLDTRGDVVQGAQVQLVGPSHSVVQTKSSGSDGQFDFAGVPAGSYKIVVSGNGMSMFASGTFQLKPGEFRIAPTITLAVSGGATSVTVTADKEQLAEQQVRIAEQQRIGGVIPNFYSAYDWDAPPMMAKQKFKLSFRSLIDPVSIITVAGIAGAEQYQGLFSGYGSGIGGFGKRFGAAYANRFAGDMLSRAAFPSIFHQDPRYFYKGKGSVGSRALYAMSRAVVTRTDDGRLRPNYSEVLGDFSAGAISNLYYPQSDRGVSLVMLNGATGVGANAVSNLIREFLLKGLTSHVPKGTNGQP